MLDTLIDIRTADEPNEALLCTYLMERLPHRPAITDIRQLRGGYSNISFLIRAADQKNYVLKRYIPLKNHKPERDIRREYHLLQCLNKGLAKLGPRPILFIENSHVAGSPAFLMERVEGLILKGTMPIASEVPAATFRLLSQRMIEKLGEVHKQNTGELKLDFLPKADVLVELKRCKNLFEADKTLHDPLRELIQGLLKMIPKANTKRLLHRDFRFENLMLSPDLKSIVSVLDWEDAALGDPLWDLGLSLANWPEADSHPALKMLNPTHFEGFMTRKEAAKFYCQTTGIDCDNILFYFLLASLKAGLQARQAWLDYQSGQIQDPRFAGLIHLAEAFVEQGIQALKRKEL